MNFKLLILRIFLSLALLCRADWGGCEEIDLTLKELLLYGDPIIVEGKLSKLSDDDFSVRGVDGDDEVVYESAYIEIKKIIFASKILELNDLHLYGVATGRHKQSSPKRVFTASVYAEQLRQLIGKPRVFILLYSRELRAYHYVPVIQSQDLSLIENVLASREGGRANVAITQ